IMLLGNTSWRIRRVESGRVLVEDAQGAPPNVPFWRGEAPGRTAELSQHVSAVREKLNALLPTARPAGVQRREPTTEDNAAPQIAFSQDTSISAANDPSAVGATQAASTNSVSNPEIADAIAWLRDECSLDQSAAEQLIEYILAGRAVLGAVPTEKTIIAERFFDESGGMQLVLHAPFGARINKAWGLALRKRFCRSFNFELQAAATDNGIVLSLSDQHSFPLELVFSFLKPQTVEHVLTQALLDAPMLAHAGSGMQPDLWPSRAF